METKFMISRDDRNTPCILSEPDYGTPLRVVLGVHGIAGSKNDDIQKSIAEEMTLFGSTVLRFDFPAHGENEEDVLTLCGCVDTLLDVAEWAAERYPRARDLCIFATGFGAYVTLMAMQDLIELPLRVRLVIQTPSLRMDQTVLGITRVTPVTLEAMDMVIFKATRPLGFSYSFYEELVENPALAAYPLPFLILHGQYDDYIPMADIQQLHDLNDRSKLVIIPGASHHFLEPGAWDMVLDLTRDWFEYEQVLLTEAY